MKLQNQKIDALLKEIIYWLFTGLFCLTPLFFTWSNQELFELNKMVLIYIGAVLIVGVWVVRCLLAGHFIWKKTWLDIPVALFFLSQLVATIFSIHLPTSLWGYYTRFNGGLMSFVAYIALFYALVSNFEAKNDLKRFLKPNFYILCLVSLWAILEHFGHSFSCVLINGNFNVSCWVQDVQTRVFASFGQPNWLAVFLVSWLGILSVWLWDAFHQKTWPQFFNSASWTKIILTFGLMLILLALIFTKSRSGLLAAGGAGVILLIGWTYQHWQGKPRNYGWILSE